MITVQVADFEDWRLKSRALLTQNINPTSILWEDCHAQQNSLFEEDFFLALDNTKSTLFNIPKKFILLAQVIACHRSALKWDKLYQLLWRLTHGERHLLEVSADKLVHDLFIMEKAIKRDAHKMKAFVRFCKFQDESESREDYYLAWYKPDHFIVRLVAPFFQRRFSVMNWIIITPDETVNWNGKELQYSEGKYLSANPTDELEQLWQTYYKAIFNPARIKIKTMKKEMPTRYWHNLPETQMIPLLLKEAPERVKNMMNHNEGFESSAQDFIPEVIDSISTLKESARHCKGCPLYQNASQTVFGKGNPQAQLVLVGEQPGDQEDLTGEPFIGPAGRVLRNALNTLNIDVDELYLTNAVKHFKFSPSGTIRKHVTPNIREINACKPWLHAEINLIQPKVVLCLGLSAAKSIINPAFRIKQERGQFKKNNQYLVGATYHPSAILRAITPDLEKVMLHNFILDIEKAYMLSKA